MAFDENEFLGRFESNAELARKLDIVINQIIGSGVVIPDASMQVLSAAAQRIRLFIHPEAL